MREIPVSEIRNNSFYTINGEDVYTIEIGDNYIIAQHIDFINRIYNKNNVRNVYRVKAIDLKFGR